MQNNFKPPAFSCIAVTQPVGTFYITTAPARDIMGYLTVSRRGLSPEDRNKVQRALDPTRCKEISEYVKREDATFPTSITVNADSQRLHVLSTEAGLLLIIGREVEGPLSDNDDTSLRKIETESGTRWFAKLTNDETPTEIIDGQHRFEGLRKAIRESSDDEYLNRRLQDFELTVAVMFDLLPEQCAKIFVTINATQRKVDPSLIADLFALHSTRSPQRVSHLIAVTANELQGSPFKGGLKMLGKRVRDGQYLSQGSFTKYLMTLLPRATKSGEVVSQSSTAADVETRPFSDLYHQKDDKQIAEIVLNFFVAAASAYPTAWTKNPDDYLIRKTVGFAALIKLLRKILPCVVDDSRSITLKFFNAVFLNIKSEFPEERGKVGCYASSDAEAGKIAQEMFNIVKDKLQNLLKENKD